MTIYLHKCFFLYGSKVELEAGENAADNPTIARRRRVCGCFEILCADVNAEFIFLNDSLR
jgi:hypothetical protein